MKKNGHECAVCKKVFTHADVLSAHLVRDTINALIRHDHPDWSDESYICRSDLAVYRTKYVHSLLESDKGELSDLEKDVLDSLQKHELISSNIDDAFERDRSLGERLADRLAAFGGSWSFLIIFGLFLLAWIVMNSMVLFWRPVDPYPYIFLNLILSCLAAIQAPVIMMSQNRQEVKDRRRAEHDYKVNLKAELEIRQIHEKLDHLLNKQWERLVQIQEIQIEQLSEINELKNRPARHSP
jgi:uncharacterized membrane protein